MLQLLERFRSTSLIYQEYFQTTAHKLGLSRVGACFLDKSDTESKNSWFQERPECVSTRNALSQEVEACALTAPSKTFFPSSLPTYLHFYCSSDRYKQEKSRKNVRTEMPWHQSLEVRTSTYPCPICMSLLSDQVLQLSCPQRRVRERDKQLFHLSLC